MEYFYRTALGSGMLGMLPEVASAARTPRHRGRGRHHHRRPTTISTVAVCDATSCPNGCCVNNTCHTNDPAACGTGGGLCVQCPAGIACASGTCQTAPPPGPCDATTCPNGCCINNTCHEGDPAACGTGGGSCTQCGTAAGVTCVSGACQPGPPPPPCNATTCPNGCCANGECHVHDPQFCGSGGGLCFSCPVGEGCFSGKCNTGNIKRVPSMVPALINPRIVRGLAACRRPRVTRCALVLNLHLPAQAVRSAPLTSSAF
jgi:hypothetical protein